MAYTDIFTDSNGTALDDHGVLWIPIGEADGIEIQSNEIISRDGGNDYRAYYYNQAANDKHYSKIEITTLTTANFIGPAIRVQSAANSSYYCFAGKSASFTYNGQNVADSQTDWDSGQALVSANDVVELQVDATTATTILYKVNGSTIETYTNKSALSGGGFGVNRYGSVGPTADNWEGGDVEAAGTTLTVQDGQHTQTGDSPHLSQVHLLVVADGEHTQEGDSPHLSQNQFLSVADGEHTHEGDNVVLGYVGVGTLTVQDGQHTQEGDSPHLSQDQFLTVADGEHTQEGDSPHLSQNQFLVVADGEHTHSGDSIVLVQLHVLVVAMGVHTQTADSPHLSQDQFVVVQDGEHEHIADGIRITGIDVLLVRPRSNWPFWS